MHIYFKILSWIFIVLIYLYFELGYTAAIFEDKKSLYIIHAYPSNFKNYFFQIHLKLFCRIE